MQRVDGLNGGIIRFGPPAAPGNSPRTFVLSGLGRSGTSMLAVILAELGFLSREHCYPVTLEDRELFHLLSERKRQDLINAIAARNQQEMSWAFKIPSIHGYLEPSDLALFRNPHLMVVVRDLVAVAARHAISELVDPVESLFEAAQGEASFMDFLRRVTCPVLFISYEKALRDPVRFIGEVARFAAVTLDGEQAGRLAWLVEPNNVQYAQTAVRRFAGYFDGLINGRLAGWAWQEGESKPVSVDILADGNIVATAVAELYRDDLKAAGIGSGRHGFDVEARPLGLAPSAVLTVRISGRNFELAGSGGRVGDSPGWFQAVSG